MIPQTEWKWFGSAAHFIASFDCHWHLATQVGDYIVSSVGEYLPQSLPRKGKIEYQDIGLDRKFETMVFEVIGQCECGCGLPAISGSELAVDTYNDAASATAGHYAMCVRYASDGSQERDEGAE